MKVRIARLGLAAAVAVGVALPAASHAFYCNPDLEPACAAVAKACRTVNDATKGRVECAFA